MWKWITDKVLRKPSDPEVTIPSPSGNGKVTEELRNIPGREWIMSCGRCGRFVSSKPNRVHNCKKL